MNLLEIFEAALPGRNIDREINYNLSKIIRDYLWKSFDFREVTGTQLSCWEAFSLFHRFCLFWETFILMICFGWLLPNKISFVFIILAFNEVTLRMTFGMARDLYRRCRDVVYGSYALPTGNHVITCVPKLPYAVTAHYLYRDSLKAHSQVSDTFWQLKIL